MFILNWKYSDVARRNDRARNYQKVEAILLVEFDIFMGTAQAFILGHPVLFVLTSGLIVTIWSVIGDTITYWAARLGGRPLTDRMARWFRMDTRHMERTESMFHRWGLGLIMFGRILPGVRMLVSVPAGITRMNFGVFFGASLGGAYIWNTLLMAIGYLLGFKLTLFGFSLM
jgi:membrane protein DedA with SNARE-associated domain